MAAEYPAIPMSLVYEGEHDVPIAVANQFVVQNYEGSLLLVAGQVSPPIVLGATPEERIEKAQALTHIPIRVVARLVITPGRAQELADLLQKWLHGASAGQGG